MSDATWKQSERAIARRLNGRRTGPSGRSGPDVESSWLRVEVKTRRHLPNWLFWALRQARFGCPDDRLAVVVLHQIGQHHADDLVLLTLGDFQAWFGDVPTAALAAVE